MSTPVSTMQTVTPDPSKPRCSESRSPTCSKAHSGGDDDGFDEEGSISPHRQITISAMTLIANRGDRRWGV